MVKKTIAITIDMEIYLAIQNLKGSGKEINISDFCNNSLKSLIITDEEKKPSFELQEELKESQQKILLLQSKLNKAKEEEKKEYEEQIQKAQAMQKALRNARVMDF